MKERINSIDALKGFGIYCVTLGHLGCWYFLEKYIYSFHMCLFFFISGYLFYKQENLASYFKKKFFTLFIPFAIWNVLSCFVDFALGNDLVSVVRSFFIIDGKLCSNAPIWFLLILFFTEIIFAMFVKIINEKYVVALLLTSFLIWFFIGGYNLTLKLNLLPMSLAFFSFGYIYKGLKSKENQITLKNIHCVYLVCLSVISVWFGVVLNIRVSYTGGVFGNRGWFVISAISGVLFIFNLFMELSKYFPNMKILCLLGRNSFVIMVMQYWFFKFFDILSGYFWGYSVWHERNMLKAVIVSTLTIYLIITVVNSCKKQLSSSKEGMYLLRWLGIY